MNKDGKELCNDNLNKSVIKESTDSLKKLKQSLDEEVIKLEKEFLLIESNLFNKKKHIDQEIDKIKKRVQKDIEYTYKFSLEKFINELLEIIDNLERSLNLSNKLNDNFIEIINKLELSIKLYLDILNLFGVSVIDTIDVPFNPDIHQAMSIQFSETIKDNHVISILQKGYLLHNRLLRPAMVIVSQVKK
ncbi:nucleotide exchange factor GrpE [Buchnera aphidicola (Pemphigus obesinymphae)]|uniref:nucleotide exchange factor GrpE n=1 Tax=Buchnera aphidicola TaxID=9 RepID=UPI0022374C9A|nr:nucleotide exchange factor GrpE [Buchnera aphidicola]MCW5196488.1 nucleotide exchange factor GrpE [Buchnera aphidicola (Pemphigus obesinymphae)]